MKALDKFQEIFIKISKKFGKCFHNCSKIFEEFQKTVNLFQTIQKKNFKKMLNDFHDIFEKY